MRIFGGSCGNNKAIQNAVSSPDPIPCEGKGLVTFECFLGSWIMTFLQSFLTFFFGVMKEVDIHRHVRVQKICLQT